MTFEQRTQIAFAVLLFVLLLVVSGVIVRWIFELAARSPEIARALLHKNGPQKVRLPSMRDCAEPLPPLNPWAVSLLHAAVILLALWMWVG